MATKPSSPPSHGGSRPNAGRKTGSGNYGEPTVAVRVPESWGPNLKAALAARKQGMPDGALRPAMDSPTRLPWFSYRVPAGFPSPAEDYAEGKLDLNQYIVEHEAATFYIRVQGHSMTGAGILDGDVIAVDRSLEAQHGDVVLAVIDGELTVKELYKKNGQIRLVAHNPDFIPIVIREGQKLTVWGVVTGVIRKLR